MYCLLGISFKYELLVVNFTTKNVDPKYSNSFSGRESLRDTVSLQSPSGRYSPVRRASDGCSPVSHVRNQLDRMFYQTISGHQTTSDSFKAVLQEYQQLQVLCNIFLTLTNIVVKCL